MKRICKQFLQELDMFAANPTLRSRKQPYSGSPCLGAFSLIIIGFFMALFILDVKLIAELDSSKIQSSINYQKQFKKQAIENLMIGISFAASSFNQSVLNKNNVSSFSNFFTIEVWANNQTHILQPCTKDQWAMIGDGYQTLFQNYRLNIAYCLPNPVSVQADSQHPFLIINFSKCIPKVNPNCVERGIIDEQIQHVINQWYHFPVWVNFLSPFVDINSKNPIKYEIRYKKASFSPFYDKITSGDIHFEKYQVNSDYNVWPFGKNEEVLSGFAPTTDYFSFQQVQRNVDNSTMMIFYCLKSEKIKVHQRTITKIDQVLSDIGGLLGLIILVFQLCIGRYNEYKYELKVGESSFNYDNNGFKVKSKDLNGFTYIKYSIYSLFRLIGVKLNWKYYKNMNETLFQAKYCLDATKLFKRIEFIQRVVWKQVDPDVIRTQSLVEPDSIDQIKRKRHFYEYYQEVIQMEQALSVEDVIQGDKQDFSYLKFKIQAATKNAQPQAPENNKNTKQTEYKEKGEDKQIKMEKQTTQQIMDSLMYDLGLEQFENVCKKLSNSKESQAISEEAKKMKLKENCLQDEKILVRSFISLTADEKKKVLMKIPLKILHRLRLSAKQMNKNIKQGKPPKQKISEEVIAQREAESKDNKKEAAQIARI